MNIFKRKHSWKELSKMLDDAMANAERITKRLDVLENEFDKRGELIAIQKETIADQEKQISVLKETIAAQKEWIDEDEKKLAIYDKIYGEIGIQMDQWFEKQTEHFWNDV